MLMDLHSALEAARSSRLEAQKHSLCQRQRRATASSVLREANGKQGRIASRADGVNPGPDQMNQARDGDDAHAVSFHHHVAMGWGVMMMMIRCGRRTPVSGQGGGLRNQRGRQASPSRIAAAIMRGSCKPSLNGL
ncbi:uncharacterized protein UV8b_06568 [Ustilaginoidea virens]|uniref:Uncharacterized protein n=1 Tax=Ustilaginoidea virens TaxID=1159556 RepID=A0A8E5MK55_USTVR|nr:uncharacterized protein UV8b_06568 [Ustilaginoidea virens]QUC22327.1 hypothetical protein UV8b_06568 [Ustilaginoidea virens]